MDGTFVPFAESDMGRRARRLGGATERDESTFYFTVSEANGGHVPVQISDAEAFLATHEGDLAELMSRDGVESGLLDFGWEISRDRVMQWNCFPPSLLALCSRLGLDLHVSVYLCDDAGDSDA